MRESLAENIGLFEVKDVRLQVRERPGAAAAGVPLGDAKAGPPPATPANPVDPPPETP